MQYCVNAMMIPRGRRVNLNVNELLNNVKHQDVKNILRSINDLNTDNLNTSTCPAATLIRIMVDRNIGDIASNISRRRDLGTAKIITELFIHHCIRLYHTDIFTSPDDARYIAELSEWVGDAMYDIPSGKEDGIKQDYREIWYTAISSLFTKDVFSRDLIEERDPLRHHPNASLELQFLSRDPARGLKGVEEGQQYIVLGTLGRPSVCFCNVVCIRAELPTNTDQRPSAKRSSTEAMTKSLPCLPWVAAGHPPKFAGDAATTAGITPHTPHRWRVHVIPLNHSLVDTCQKPASCNSSIVQQTSRTFPGVGYAPLWFVLILR